MSQTYEWDPGKADANWRKHGVGFADAIGVFEDPLVVMILDDDAEEDRRIAVGRDFLDRTLVVVYTWRGSAIRVISARRATRGERRAYEGTRS
jgi:uncharacterized DUF497 family protein